MKRIAELIECLENDRISIFNYLLGFGFIVFIRDYAEAFSRHINYFNIPSGLLATDIIHFTLSYLFLACLIMIVLHGMTGAGVVKVIKVVLASFILLWVCPVVDLMIYARQGVNLLYIQPGIGIKSVPALFFSYFGNFPGVSIGLRVEIAIALCAVYMYCRVKKQGYIRSGLTSLLVYTTIFLWGSSPYFIEWMARLLGMSYAFSSSMMLTFYMLVLPMAGCCIGYLASPGIFTALVKDMRFLRVLHYELMIVLGATLGLIYYDLSIKSQLQMYPEIIVNMALSMLAIVFASMYAIVVNNVADIEIDKICNQSRPLVKHAISDAAYQKIGYSCLFAALFYAMMINAKIFLLVSVFVGLYYVYSVLPWRLKRLFLLSKLVISLNSISLVMMGYLIVRDSLIAFPDILYAIFLFGFTLAANFIDLKDVKGDKANKIYTLPIAVGDKWARRIIGYGFIVTYMSFYFLLQQLYLLPMMLAGGLIQYYYINKSVYEESKVLIFHAVSMLALIGWLILIHSTRF